jgi:type II secretory pathway pseudopilin PulG
MQVRRAKPQQAGFFLLELTIGVAILGVAVLAMYSAISSLNQMERGKRVGHQYALINEALGQYMATHYKQLKSLNPNCSQHSLGRLISKARPESTCRMAVTSTGTNSAGVTVLNGLQPTVQELILLGFLKDGVKDAPAFEVSRVVAESDVYGSISNNLTPSRFFALIEQRCIPTAVNSSLQGRYVLIRHAQGQSGVLALDEVEIIVNGVNVAPQARLSQSSGGSYADALINAADFYSINNLVDGRTSSAQATSQVGNAYVLPGLYRSNSAATPWVLFDLGASQTLSSVGLRSANGAWAAEGNQLVVFVSQDDPSAQATQWDSLLSMENSRWGKNDYLTPGIKTYLNASDFSFKAPTATGSLPAATGCPSGTLVALSSLVFNTQPFVMKDMQGSMAMLSDVASEAGGDAAMSNPLIGGELQGIGGSFVLNNPVRDWQQGNASKGVGVGAIIAVRNGYATYSTALQVRADGSSPPTSDWQFGGQSLTHINLLASNAASVDNDMGVGGRLYARDGKFSNSLTLPQVNVGETCTALKDSLAQSAGLILRCQSGKWRSITSGTVNSLEYYEVDIKSLKDGVPFTVINYCVNQSCQSSAPVEIPSAPTNATTKLLQTTLKTNEWFPVVGSFSQTRNSGSLQSASYGLDEAMNGWLISLYALANSEDANLKIRFYKINP